MGIEIERKFLVKNDSWRAVADAGKGCRQGYLVAEKEKSIRVRIMGEKAFLTIKICLPCSGCEVISIYTG